MGEQTLVFGRYRLDEQVGAGGMGAVWKSTDQLLHQTVALKRVCVTALSPTQAQLAKDRALREARLAAQLRGHPHVVAVYDVLAEDTDIWLVMEYLPAQTLAQIVKTDGPLSPGETARIGAAVADALAASHARGIEHRDVTPANVLIGDNGTVKLTDYGISHLSGDPQLTQTGITGTTAYLAPEVAGRGDSSPASDVFSLGSTLYYTLEGQPPFGTDDNALKLLNIVRTGIIRQPTHAGALEPLLLRLLSLDPTTRPDAATARDMLHQHAISDPSPGAQPAIPPPLPPGKPFWHLPRRLAVPLGVLAAAATAATLAIVIKDGHVPGATLTPPSPGTLVAGAQQGQSSTPAPSANSAPPPPAHNDAQIMFSSPPDAPIKPKTDVPVTGTVEGLGANTLWILAWHQSGGRYFPIPNPDTSQMSPVTTKDGPWHTEDDSVGDSSDIGKTIAYTAILANTECAKQLTTKNEPFIGLPDGCVILGQREVRVQ